MPDATGKPFQCIAIKRGPSSQDRGTNDERCKSPASRGQRVCSKHGGKSPQALKKAAERLEAARAEAAVRKVMEKWTPESSGDIDVLDELLKTVAMVTAWRDFMSDRLTTLQAESYRYPDRAGEQLRADVALFERGLDRAARLLIDVSKLGLAEKRLELDKQHAEMTLAVLAIAMKTLGLNDDSPEVRAAVSGAFMQLSAEQATRQALTGPRVSPVRR